jgi:CubicO group peptidase (beta-lactamase class C family)
VVPVSAKYTAYHALSHQELFIRAIGMAVQEGSFSLQDKVASFFPEHLPPNLDPKVTAMTVEDLLTHTSGHATAVSGGTRRGIETNWTEQFFKLPVVHGPGTIFKYTSATSFLLSAIVKLTTGQRTRQYLMPRLLQPLGITDLTWDVGPDGTNPGGNGISCRPSDLLKLAILHLQGGVWEGRRLLTKEWVANAT